MASSSSSPPPPPLPPPPSSRPAAASSNPQPPPSSRRLPPPCWSHEETSALIDAYRLKWYSLNRGNLKASHWQEVADSVTSSCPHVSPPKTSLQCRHKIEKLRKRYRNEKQRSIAGRAVPSWPYFRKMDSMEIGAPSPNSDTTDDEEDAADAGRLSHTRSLHRLLITHPSSAGHQRGRSGASAPTATRIKIVKREAEEESPGFGAVKRRRTRRADSAADLVSAIRMLGEGFLKMERTKMEVVRDLEKMRVDMEMKRTEMILESQQRVVDAFIDGFAARDRSEKASPPPEPEQ